MTVYEAAMKYLHAGVDKNASNKYSPEWRMYAQIRAQARSEYMNILKSSVDW